MSGARAGATSVLLVDDEIPVARTHARILSDAGYEVTVAHAGADAIELVSRADFDVIVSDIHMPGMTGLGILRSIRARNLDVPVVFVTGNPAIETIMEAMEYGAFRYVIKPVPKAELLAVVERACQHHRLAVVRREAGVALSGKLVGDRAGLEARFASAIARMWIAMQPVISWKSRTTYAYEALLRTDEPTLRSPADFVEAAERLGCTQELGRLVRRAIADAIADAPAAATVFVNLHPNDLADEELAATDGALSPHASRIVLEVTERATLDKVGGLPARVAGLRDLGFRIALDDLGAGYAGLSSFAQLEPDIVKVDMSLVRDIHASPLKQKLFGSFARLCEDLRVGIVAEGVEAAEERACLSDLGGDLFQGYLFAPPSRGFPQPRF